MNFIRYALLVIAGIAFCSAQAGLESVPLPADFNIDDFCQSREDGNYPHPALCTSFIQCSGNRTFIVTCPGDLLYSHSTNQCEYAENVNCVVIQNDKVCYGAKDSSFGTFALNNDGVLRQLSLEHLSGSVSCDVTKGTAANSNWGCGLGFLSVRMGTVVTYPNNTLVFPFFAIDENGYYGLARTDTFSRVLTLYNFDNAIKVKRGQQLRIWHGEDLVNKNEDNNGGEHCVRVWASFYVSRPNKNTAQESN